MKTTLQHETSRFPALLRAAALPVLVALLIGALAGCGSEDAASQGQEAPPEAPAEHAQGESHGDESTHAGEEEGQHAEGEGAAREVELTEEQMQRLGIAVDSARGGRATSTIERPATVMFDPDRTAQVGPRVEGQVVRVTADLGERVREGETLAILSSVELGRARSAYQTALARLATERRTYEREQQLRADSISSEADLLEAQAQFEEAQAELGAAREALRLYGLSDEEIESQESHGEPLSHFHVRSPISGVVQEREASPGETVGPQDTPFHVADPSRMWAMIDAYERDARALEEGQPVTLTVRSRSGETFGGTIDFVSYALDEESRTLRARAVIDNAEGLLRAGMYGTATIQTGRGQTDSGQTAGSNQAGGNQAGGGARHALLPSDAVQTIGDEQVVFVPGERAGHFRAVPVRTGEESQGGMTEILAGLRPGDRAVTEGAFDLKAALTASGRSAAHSH